MKDLGLQTAQAIAASSDPIEKLGDIVHGFPMHAPALSSIKVQGDLRENLIEMYKSGALEGVPTNSLFVNGIRVDLAGNTFNVYDFLNDSK